MDAKTTSIVAYLTWIGLLIAFLAGDKDDPLAKCHLNNALVGMLFMLLGIVPVVGWLWDLFMVVIMIIAFVKAIQGEEYELILLGKIKIIK